MLAQKWKELRAEEIRKWEDSCKYEDFIDDRLITELIDISKYPDKKQVEDIIAKARQNVSSGAMLSPSEVAVLANTQDPQLWEAIFETADWIKRTVYGNRIVLFAPLYLSSMCVNNCLYCGFKNTNADLDAQKLNRDQIVSEVEVLINSGHKRLIAVYGEHPQSDAEYICQSVETIYSVHSDCGEIRRCNINASPMFENEYKQIKDVGIGTYQIFQETYHHQTYSKVHPRDTLKHSYKWRVFGLHRAFEAGIDDIAIGVLFGLYDWKFELLGLLYHAMALEKEFGVGPHTISYPRLVPAENAPLTTMSKYLVSDEDFSKIVAIIRLMCPYTGSILTARESNPLRDTIIRKGGVSQMDAGTRIGIGGYSQMEKEHLLHKEQFIINDTRSLDDFIYDLCKEGYLPSFCTAGYREGRTGANFMPLAKHATVKNFCVANGILTFKEYLMDYASPKVREIGENHVIPNYLQWIEQNMPQLAVQVEEKLGLTASQQHDMHF